MAELTHIYLTVKGYSYILKIISNWFTYTYIYTGVLVLMEYKAFDSDDVNVVLRTC